MTNKESTIARMKEIIEHYRNMKKKMQKQKADTFSRKYTQQFIRQSLEELETLIVGL